MNVAVKPPVRREAMRIAGRLVETGDTLDVFNPYTNEVVGTVPAVVVGGLGTLAVAGLWSRWFPALRDRDKLVG